jgi:hypothetical protein
MKPNPKDDTDINHRSNSLLDKDIVSCLGIEEDEIYPHNEVSGIPPSHGKNEDSHVICESLLSHQTLLTAAELKDRILKMLPLIVEHQQVCKVKSKSCQLNSVLLQYFIQKEFIDAKKEPQDAVQ